MTKNEREQFKAEFIVSDCTSIREFCRSKGINWQSIKNYCAKEIKKSTAHCIHSVWRSRRLRHKKRCFLFIVYT